MATWHIYAKTGLSAVMNRPNQRTICLICKLWRATHGRQKRLSRLQLRLPMTDVWKPQQSFSYQDKKVKIGILQ